MYVYHIKGGQYGLLEFLFAEIEERFRILNVLKLSFGFLVYVVKNKCF
jgi:hypothetical protein